MRRPEAVLFDNDLTLCDTFPSIYGGFAYALSGVSIEVSEDLVKGLVGETLTDCYRSLASGYDIEKLALLHGEFQRNNLHLIKPFLNTRWTVGQLYNAGIKIGVVTNRDGVMLHQMLRDAGIYESLGAIVTNRDVSNPKPHPEHALAALEKLGARAENSWFVGDADVDIVCGKGAGMRTVGAMWAHPNGKEWKLRPDYLAYDIGDLVLPLVMGEQYFNQDFS